MCRYTDLGFTLDCEFISSLPQTDAQTVKFQGELCYRKKRIAEDIILNRYGYSGDLIIVGPISSTTIDSCRKLTARYGRKVIATVHPTRPHVISTVPLDKPTVGQFIFGTFPERFTAVDNTKFERWARSHGISEDSLMGFRRWEALRKEGLQLLEGIPKTVLAKVKSLLNSGSTH